MPISVETEEELRRLASVAQQKLDIDQINSYLMDWLSIEKAQEISDKLAESVKQPSFIQRLTNLLKGKKSE